MKPSEKWQAINDNQFWKHLPKDYKSHHTYVISEEVLKKVGEITLDGRVISAQTQLKIIIQNSKQLHDNGWFYDLTKRKTKNPTRKEVI